MIEIRRRVRRGRGRAPRSARERREVVASLVIVGATKLALGLALAVSAAQSYHLFQRQVVMAPARLAGVVPLVLVLGSALALVAGLRNLRSAARMRRAPLADGPADAEP